MKKYLSDNRDSRFATKCRKALLNSNGKVEFPTIPQSNNSQETISGTILQHNKNEETQ